MHNQFKTQKFKHLMLAMGPRDLNSAPYSPVHCSSHSMTSFQSSELTELPVVENSQLFAQRAHSACTAHGTPPKDRQNISSEANADRAGHGLIVLEQSWQGHSREFNREINAHLQLAGYLRRQANNEVLSFSATVLRSLLLANPLRPHSSGFPALGADNQAKHIHETNCATPPPPPESQK